MAGTHKSVGIDPGSRYWKLCVLDDEGIIARHKIETSGVSENPASILETLEKHVGDLEVMAAPSGHGLPATEIANVGDDELRQMTLKRDGPGIVGLSASIGILREFCGKRNIRCYVLPSVKHLSTVPEWRKINRIDLGTSDKVCSAAFSLQKLSEDRGLALDDTSFILIDIGHSFLAMICVEKGRIVDGIGGSLAGFGTVASGAIDAELLHAWDFPDKSSLYSGGLVHASGISLEEIESRLPDDLGSRASMALKRFLESFGSDLAAISSRNEVDEVVLNSVLGPKFNALLGGEVSRVGLETALTIDDEMPGCVGAAYLANGLIGGRYSSLAEQLGIGFSGGSVMDTIYFAGSPTIP
ncbi:MAG: DUF1464 family protein [Theionarchaea archaeon]|nr:DUF1464 family protein [Theionarchaea archaeon]